MRKQQATDYMYASARISALENHMVGKERIGVLTEAKDRHEVMARLSEFGEMYRLPTSAEGQGADGEHMATEKMLLSLLTGAYDEVGKIVPDPAVYRQFRYPYDCNNIKAIIKCQIRGVDPHDMLFDFGTVSVNDLMGAMRAGKYDMLPPMMAKAVVEAKEAYAKMGDPQLIDAILDKACYADMLASAQASGSDALLTWVRVKIDLVNIMICLRILRMKRGDAGRSLMTQTLLTGGYIEESFFKNAYDGGEDALWQGLASGTYHQFVKAVEMGDRSLAHIEKCVDDHYMRVVKEQSRVAFGVEIAGGYLVGWETSVKNIRIILAAKDAGLSSAVIRERIRDSYV